ncbi:MAG: 16S rRNA (uracil(1498)-N(3))-methyltransferase [Pyrinomonadaceae bacterium]
MTRRRFYAPMSAFDSSHTRVTLASDEARHLREVLRLKVGDEVYVFNGEGQEFRCRVEDTRRDAAHLMVIEEVAAARPESPLELTLAVALLKAQKFDLVVQKAIELGVSGVVPVITSRADVRLRDDSDVANRMARWQRIALEAAKQSGRAAAPAISEPVTFESLIRDANVKPGTRRLLFSERDGRSLTEVKELLSAKGLPVTALVGSEGGWTDEELAAARGAGWTIITFGGRTLRAETAAIAVAVLLQHLAGDLV